MTLDDLHRISTAQINLAGPCYTPSLDESAPNLEVTSVLEAFAGLAYADRYKESVSDLQQQLLEAWGKAPDTVKSKLNRRVNTPERIAGLLDQVHTATPSTKDEIISRLPRATKYLAQSTTTVLRDLREKEAQADGEQAEREVRNQIYRTRQLQSAVHAILEYVESPAYLSLQRNALFLHGEWGTGKTHFMCDLAARRIEQKQPTLLYLAHQLPTRTPPLQALCQTSGVADEPTELLSNLQQLGAEQASRALILIDGINEGDREQWRTALRDLALRVQKYPNVGVALSCRTPFDQQILTPKSSAHYVQVEHRGFSDVEFDAHLAFFDYYGIPAPTVPLLAPEFSRPLFLKLFCKSIKNLSTRRKKQHFKDVASGQKGMTYVFEYFTKEVSSNIEDEFGIPRLSCWKILKGVHVDSSTVVGVAPIMARELRDYVSLDECLGIITTLTGLPHTNCQDLLHRMVVEGLLVESMRWGDDAKEYVDVIQFPYQRFSDHLIARHLLNEHLSTESEETIRRSFYANRPLGQIFTLDEWRAQFAEPGLAAAIMLEFPERVKRTLPPDERELLYYLPKRCLASAQALKDIFLHGLHWRSANSFTEQTNKIRLL